MPVFWRLWDGGTGKDRRETLAVPVPGEELVNEPLLPGNTAVSFKSWHVSSAACCGCCRGFWDRTSPSVAICARLQLAVCGNWLCLYQGVKRGLVGLHSVLWSSPLGILTVVLRGALSSSFPGSAGGGSGVGFGCCPVLLPKAAQLCEYVVHSISAGPWSQKRDFFFFNTNTGIGTGVLVLSKQRVQGPSSSGNLDTELIWAACRVVSTGEVLYFRFLFTMILSDSNI